jgi:hypothetical protein
MQLSAVKQLDVTCHFMGCVLWSSPKKKSNCKVHVDISYVIHPSLTVANTWKWPDYNEKRSCFGSQFWGFQSMVGYPYCFWTWDEVTYHGGSVLWMKLSPPGQKWKEETRVPQSLQGSTPNDLRLPTRLNFQKIPPSLNYSAPGWEQASNTRISGGHSRSNLWHSPTRM